LGQTPQSFNILSDLKASERVSESQIIKLLTFEIKRKSKEIIFIIELNLLLLNFIPKLLIKEIKFIKMSSSGLLVYINFQNNIKKSFTQVF